MRQKSSKQLCCFFCLEKRKKMGRDFQSDRLKELEREKENLKQEILNIKKEKEKKIEDATEIKMRRIAMEEITRCTKEKLFRHMGYVESFYD
ncbi:hypothetical protein IR166_28695 [Enterococcus faecalis]|nr:hypothetical protein [Enterococcus faecalis]MBX8989948.1 hypothetical protein [Escherichia coli]